MTIVKSKDGVELMPCCSAVGRLLLDQGKAKCIRRSPFTIKLKYETTGYVQAMTHGLDSGSSKLGSAVVIEKTKEVVYMSVVEMRNDITKKMTGRSRNRRSRRNRTTRYRQMRPNRANCRRTDRFSPTMTSKYRSHLKEKEFVRSLFPITKTVIEGSSFDPHAMKNPDVYNDLSLYQKGVLYGYANMRAYILDRDRYVCQNPKCKKGEHFRNLEVHHIIFKSEGGSDEKENLITLCHDCHTGLHHGTVTLKLKGKKKGQLKHATQMNSIRVQLFKRVPEAVETFGYITKEHRRFMGLPKEHYTDAIAIASGGEKVTFKTDTLILKKCVSDGDYQSRKGVRSEKVIPLGKVNGFRKFDKVRHKGKNYFIKGRMSTGYFVLMDINGEKVKLSPMPTPKTMKRVSARKSWIIDEVKLDEKVLNLKNET